VASQHLVEAGPGNPPLTISPRQPFLPDPPDLVGEPSQPSRVAADAVVGEVAPHHRGQVTVLLAEGPVSVFPTPIAHCGNRPGETVLGRDLPNQHANQSIIPVGTLSIRMITVTNTETIARWP